MNSNLYKLYTCRYCPQESQVVWIDLKKLAASRAEMASEDLGVFLITAFGAPFTKPCQHIIGIDVEVTLTGADQSVRRGDYRHEHHWTTGLHTRFHNYSIAREVDEALLSADPEFVQADDMTDSALADAFIRREWDKTVDVPEGSLTVEGQVLIHPEPAKCLREFGKMCVEAL